MILFMLVAVIALIFGIRVVEWKHDNRRSDWFERQTEDRE